MNNLNPNINVNWVPGITLDEMEKQCILQAFRFYRGNKTQTAGALGIAIRTLDNKLERYEKDAQREQQRFEADKQRNADILARMRGVDLTRQNEVGSAYQIRNGAIETKQKQAEAGLQASSGTYMESPAQTVSEHEVPMPERTEVQKVLPRKAAQSGHRKSRRGL